MRAGLIDAPRDGRAPIDAGQIEQLWGVRAMAKGGGTLGLSAALWNLGGREVVEIARPACPSTHVVSLWIKGAAQSELHLDGRLRFRSRRGRGSFQLARAGETVRAVLTQAHGHCLDLYLPAAILDGYFGGGLELRPAGLEADPVIARLGDDIAAEIRLRDQASRLAIDGATLQLAACLARRWSSLPGERRPAAGGLSPAQLRRTTAYIQAHLAEDISLAELAEVANLSVFHFARSFKAAAGRPPHAYQAALRVARAKTLLAETALAIGDIARLTGFHSPQTMTRTFRREIGASPRAFRRGIG